MENQKIKKEELKKLYQNLSSVIEEISKEYSFFKIKESVLDEMIEKAIAESLKEQRTGNLTQFQTLFTNNFRKNLDQLVISNMEMKEDEDSDIVSDEYVVDSLRAYIIEIDKPLLTIEEEKQIAYRILEGDINAKTILLERNLKLVVSIAQKYIGKGLPLSDLIQEGNIGLMRAIDKYDVTKGFRFSTYATFWIKQAITRAIPNQGKLIRIPVPFYIEAEQFNRTVSNLQKELGKEPSNAEIAKKLGISLERVDQLQKVNQPLASTNTIIGNSEDSELEQFIPSENDSVEDTVVENYQKLAMKKEIMELFHNCNLKEREIEVLLLRCGFYQNKPKTLGEIGDIFHITKTRAGQIEKNALMKIRRSNYIKRLADYMDFPEQALANINTYRTQYLEKSNKKKTNKVLLKEYN